MKTKILYSGCEHAPNQKSCGFCWQCRIEELEAKLAETKDKIELAQETASDTHRSWKHRCYSIMAALDCDYGDPDWMMPDDVKKLELAEAKLASAQAKIDMLMLEYCPEEMTDEQKRVWAKNQVPAESEMRLENWSIGFEEANEYRLTGTIHDDVHGRFAAGTSVITSLVDKTAYPVSELIVGMLVATRNNIYLLGAPKR